MGHIVPNMNTQGELYDPVSNKIAFLDRFRNLRTASTKRIIGSVFASTIDTTYLYTITNTNGGTSTASNGNAILATNTTANGATSIVSKGKIRYLSGRNNFVRAVMKFGDTGTDNNVREFGIYIDSNNSFVFRLSGTTFQVVIKRGGVENVINNGSFNGNGLQSGATWTVDPNFHYFDVVYSVGEIQFVIDNNPIHTFFPTTNPLVNSTLGQLYISNANSNGSTTNVNFYLASWSANQLGDAINNPQFYNYDGGTGAETRTLKSGGGTLQSITIGKSGGANSSITFYDNTSGTGTIICTFDLNKDNILGTHMMGINGVNFNNGLTYVTAGTLTGASFTVFWE